MHFHCPRRYRRTLLFPPGLLALAGLLWLGCVVVGAHPEQLKRRSVVQLTMPPISGSDFIMPRFYGLPRLRYSNMPRLRHWITAAFGQGPAFDSMAARDLKAALRTEALGSDENPSGNGLRVQFGPRARYASMMLVLDLMSQYNIRRYFFDARFSRSRTMFYAFTGPPRPVRWMAPALVWPSRGRQSAAASTADQTVTLPQPSLYSRLTTTANWWPVDPISDEKWLLLTEPGWRAPLVLLGLISFLSLLRWRPSWL